MDSEYHSRDVILKIDSKIQELEKKLDIIIDKLERVESGTSKMSDHIDFISNVYVKVQRPLDWMCDKVNYMRGSKVENTNGKFLNSNVEEQD